jgi:hypothetical protein
MDIIEVVGQVRELLQQQGRLSYRIVRRSYSDILPCRPTGVAGLE